MVEFAELNDALLSYRMNIARVFTPSQNQIDQVLAAIPNPEKSLEELGNKALQLGILNATARFFIQRRIEIPRSSIILAGNTEQALEDIQLSYGLSVLEERGVEMPPKPLLIVETVFDNFIEPGYRKLADDLGRSMGNAEIPEEVPKDALAGFVLNHDYWYGALALLSPIPTGLEYLRGESPDLIQKSLLEHSLRDQSSTEAENADLYVRHLARFSRFAGILSKDPTGFLLVDTILDEIKKS